MTTSTQEYREIQDAVVYVRVANIDPSHEGHRLRAQEQRCRDYAAARGYAVIRVFIDAGISGNSVERPGLAAMLTYLERVRDREFVVVMEDAARLARDVGVTVELSNKIRDTGARLEFSDAERVAAIAMPAQISLSRMGRVRP